MQYKYFISYAHAGTGISSGFGFGNCDITLPKKVESVKDAAELAKVIERDGKIKSVVILFFTLLSESAE